MLLSRKHKTLDSRFYSQHRVGGEEGRERGRRKRESEKREKGREIERVGLE